MRFGIRVFVVAAVGLLVVAPGRAAADWFITPFAGANFGGNTGDKKFDAGVSLGGMGKGVVGGEIDEGRVESFGRWCAADLEAHERDAGEGGEGIECVGRDGAVGVVAMTGAAGPDEADFFSKRADFILRFAGQMGDLAVGKPERFCFG